MVSHVIFRRIQAGTQPHASLISNCYTCGRLSWQRPPAFRYQRPRSMDCARLSIIPVRKRRVGWNPEWWIKSRPEWHYGAVWEEQQQRHAADKLRLGGCADERLRYVDNRRSNHRNVRHKWLDATTFTPLIINPADNQGSGWEREFSGGCSSGGLFD